MLTLVLWLGCVTVGVLGLVFSYPRPRPRLPTPAPVRVEAVEVEVTRVPWSPAESVPTLAAVARPMPARPAPVPAPMVLAEAAPLLAVASPSPAIAFALPVEGPARVVRPAQAAAAVPATPGVAPTQPPSPQALTLGQGEGRQPAPAYPRAAVRAGQEGTVRIGFTVGEDGRVLGAEVLAASPWPLLNEAAVRTVRQRWRFAPGVPRHFEVPIHFQLDR